MIDILITDGHQRKAIPIVRALGREGLKVAVGGESRFSPAFFSKYCFHKIKYPSVRDNQENFVDFLVSYLKKNAPKVLLSLDEWTNDVVTQHIEEFSKYTRVPLPPNEVYLKARDKAQLLKIARDLGIPCPDTYIISDISEVSNLAETLDFPVIIKPRMSAGSRGLVKVTKQRDLVSFYLKVHRSYPFPIIQEFIPEGGDAFGVEVLINAFSKPRAIFVHRRLREYPVNGGPSTLRESVDYPELAEIGVKLLKTLNWFGVAMVEFRVDPRDRTPKLMEVNAKFWGSINLPIVSGINFPYLLFRMALDGDVEAVINYKVGVKCRWLLPGDIMHFLANKNRLKLNPSFFRFFDDDTYYDILSKEDPGPVLGTVIYYLSKILSPKLLRDLTR